MSEFVQGQRWVADSEPELGLGIVIAVEARRVTVRFTQAEVERTYNTHEAPLTRIRFEPGDEITLRDGDTATVNAVLEQDGLLIYDVGAEQLVVETMLAGEIRLNQPLMRLLTGQINEPKWFGFRRQLDRSVARVWRSRLAGLLGTRTNLIPHQLYVAWVACEREQVRVLLADEVGLGKTIEAGMILSRLLKFERVSRALVVVPDALQVQWLVELVRRFSLKPELYSGEDHEFDLGQIHIVPHSALATDAERILNGGFDIAIVDEAHQVAPGTDAFDTLSHLSMLCEHLMLLTATPEQLGLDAHFERLRLLDAAKFNSLDDLLAKEEEYKVLNSKLRELPATRDELLAAYKIDATVSDNQLVDELLDCHGIGRVMFRNVRKAIAGFPARQARFHLLEDDSWEARFEWLAQWLRQESGGEKALVIMHSLEDVQDCEQYLWQKHGIHVAVFHEQQSLIERDSAAAYFADLESGSQVLLCSEIGSEGRNFQFSRHLVCLDLPDNPDILEQRIGRLDRIGQTRDVNIHIPYAAAGDMAVRAAWFHRILNCIEQQNPAATTIHHEFWSKLGAEDLSALAQGDPAAEARVPETQLLQSAEKKLTQLQQDIEQGRDALLEMNSCRQPTANQLVDSIAEFESDTPQALVELASELLQFHFEETLSGIYSLIPSDKMLIAALPGIPPDGAEVTFSRTLANAREDVLFITWDSPFIQGLWEMLHHSELGSASVAALPNPNLPIGQCLLEATWDIVIQSPHSAQCLPFLPTQSVRVLVLDKGNKDLADAFSEEALDQSLVTIKKHIARQVIDTQKADIPAWHQKADSLAEVRREGVVGEAIKSAEDYFENEIARLQRLAEKNSVIDSEDVAALESKKESLLKALRDQAFLQLSSMRLIVITSP